MKALRTGLVLCGSAALIATAVACAAQEPSATWSIKTAMPYERSEVTVAMLDNKAYVIGGNSPGTEATGFIQEYDPVADRWLDDFEFMPRVASHAGSAVLNGKIYVVGGFVANVHIGAVDRVFEFDPANNNWRAVASLSAPRGSPGVVAVDGKIHAIGGRNPDFQVVNTHEVYDPATDTWTMAAPLPVGRDHLGIAVLDGKIHVFGGRTGPSTDLVGNHDVYDPATDTWSTAAPLNVPRSAGVGFVIDGKIVYAGGECKDPDAGTTFNEAEIYDPASDSWSRLPDMMPGRHAAGATVINGEALIFGGNAGCGGRLPQDTVLALDFN